METINGYLSRRLADLWPTAMVYQVEDQSREHWVLRRDGLEDLGLGSSFAEANQAVQTLLRVERARSTRER